MALPCERCPVRAAIAAEQADPGALYQYQLELAEYGADILTQDKFDVAIAATADGMESALPDCPGISKARYFMGKVGSRFLKYTDFYGKTPHSMDIAVVCNNPFLDSSEYEEIWQDGLTPFFEY